MSEKYVFLSIKGHYLSLLDDEETIELTEDKSYATAFPADVVADVEAAMREAGVEEDLEQTEVDEAELEKMVAAEDLEDDEDGDEKVIN